jgi:hypothetical protein
MYGRPLYGGNPFDPPGTGNNTNHSMVDPVSALGGDVVVTSDGKTASKTSFWGALPTGTMLQVEEDDEESDEDDDMEGSSEEEEGEATFEGDEVDGIESTLPPPSILNSNGPVDLRKSGLETPLSVAAAPSAPPKQLYRVMEQKQTSLDPNAVFASEMVYAMPGTLTFSTVDGAESVLSKAVPTNESNGKQQQQNKTDNDDDDDENIKKFKF